ncbi:hypothetical protein Leryth_014485 [Lithospermum erythrorhizon]|nr:hypothetical protein Leryth_014485 [Lithospermum erythrorhizon]
MQNSSCSDFLPVASSGGLLSFSGNISALDSDQETENLRAIAMVPVAIDSSYKLVSVSGEFQELSLRVYSSRSQLWEEEVTLRRNNHTTFGTSKDHDGDEESSEYFLSKWGNVVSPNLQRSPCKRYSSVIVEKGGEEIMYFLNSTGKIIRCNLTNSCYDEYPRLLPINYEYSIDLVQCGGEMKVILLSEFLESASLKVWSLDEKSHSWQQVAMMPPSMSQEFYSKKVDINCTASTGGDQIFVCLSSHDEVYRYYLCNLSDNNWVELSPSCVDDKRDREFVCAFAFEPRIEAEV